MPNKTLIQNHIRENDVGYIFVFDFKDRGSLKISKINITSLQMSKTNIARWILLKVLLLDFYGQFEYPMFEGMFTLYN